MTPLLISLRQFNNFFKNLGLGLGEFRENFAIKFNVGFLEASDEFAVRNPIQAGSGADLNLPQTAGVAFLLAAVGKLETPGMKQSFFGLPVFGLAGPHKTLCVFEQIFPALMSDCAAFNSGHL